MYFHFTMSIKFLVINIVEDVVISFILFNQMCAQFLEVKNISISKQQINFEG